VTVIWLGYYPTNEVLGFPFGISDSSASRIRARVLPLLEAAGRDSRRMPDPGKKQRKTFDTLLKETPELAVTINTLLCMIIVESATAECEWSVEDALSALVGRCIVDGLIDALAWLMRLDSIYQHVIIRLICARYVFGS
jgi:hypothetical protein